MSTEGDTFTVYTTIPICEAPFPHGLGKLGHDELEAAMKRLLGAHHRCQAAHAQAFWTPEYQALIELYLAPFFDPSGDIVTIVQHATAHARRNPALGQRWAEYGAAEDNYWAGRPDLSDQVPLEVRRWCDFPPEIIRYGDGSYRYGNGRHRLSYLRSKIEPIDPTFEVLIKLDQVPEVCP